MTTNDTPLVSIIIPTYNRGWTIKKAIDSVLSQDYQNFELIVVDDGSTDETQSILDQYGNRLIRVRQDRRGVSAARNRGIAAAKGNLISFLDSDDAWLSGKLSRQIDFFSNQPEVLICQTEEIWIRDGVRVNPKRRHRKPSGMIFEASLELCLISPSAVMLKRQLLDWVGYFDESLPACEDYDLWLRISSRYPVHLIDEPLLIKTGGHPDQLSRMTGLDKYRIDSICKIMQSGELTSKQYQAALEVLQKKCAIYAQGCRRRGKVKEAENYLALASFFDGPIT